MNEAMQAVAPVTAKAVTVSAGMKWAAVLSGVGLLAVLYLAVTIFSSKGRLNPSRLVEGADGSASTSKFQWFLWITVILFAYTALWVLRAEQGDFSALSAVPLNILTVVGFSAGTAAAAKGITSAYVQTGRVTKPTSRSNGFIQGGILQDDSGSPELAKIQLVGFTLITTAIFLITVIHQIITNDVTSGLPNIDSALMLLMVISLGGYLGKKLVTSTPQALYAPNPQVGHAATVVGLSGVNLGSPSTSHLLLDDSQILFTSWSATQITFPVPVNDPATNAPWTGLPRVVKLTAVVSGQRTNTVLFTVTQP